MNDIHIIQILINMIIERERERSTRMYVHQIIPHPIIPIIY
jgi:hypothetical protein